MRRVPQQSEQIAVAGVLATCPEKSGEQEGGGVKPREKSMANATTSGVTPKKKTPAAKKVQARIVEDDRYEDCLAGVRHTFHRAVSSARSLFTTQSPGLYEAYLDGAPRGARTSRTCRACQQFIERFGGLVTIDANGHTSSIFWAPETAPPAYETAIRRVAAIVAKAPVDGVFISEEKTWGKPMTEAWTHFAVSAPPSQIFHLTFGSPIQTAHQAMAEKKQDYETLQRGLAEFSVEHVRLAHSYLTNGSLYRSEKCEGVAKWLLDLHEARATIKGRPRDNVVWLAMAAAPVGFCHVKAGMIGTLLEDIAAALPFEMIKERFDEKMNPLHYQRPQAPPSAGNIAQAEKIVEQLRSARALDRRFAKLTDIQAIWTPAPPKTETVRGGVFGHLYTPERSAVLPSGAPPVVMTWTKFERDILPKAETIDFLVPHGHAPYTAYVTAADPDAPPILQWDHAERRNPVSWYVYHAGSPASTWNLAPGWTPVTAVALQPSMWHGAFDHQGASVCFVLKGARDTVLKCGAGFFPETLKSEYHAVRATLEAYAQRAVIAGREEAEVCGIRLQKGQAWDFVFRVTAGGVQTAYKLDRWE